MATDNAAPTSIQCPDCRHTISGQALYCPHCGRPITGPNAQQIDKQLKFIGKSLRSIDAEGCVTAVILMLAAAAAGILLIISILNGLAT